MWEKDEKVGRTNGWCAATPFSPEKGGRKKSFPLYRRKGRKKDREEERKSLLLLSPFLFLPPPCCGSEFNDFKFSFVTLGACIELFIFMEAYYIETSKRRVFSRANFPPDFLSISYRGGGGRVGFGDKVHSTPSPTRVSISVAIRHNWFLLANW